MRVLGASPCCRSFRPDAVADLGDGDLDTLIERLRGELIEQHKVAPAQLEFHKPADYVSADRAD